MSLDDGVIQPGGRFERIEATLARIETKLDGKVNQTDFQPAIRRIEALESGETPLGRVLLEQFTQLQAQVSELLLHGSQNAQLAGRRVGELEVEVASLKTAHSARKELTDDRRARDERGLRVRALLIASLSTAAAVISVVALISGLTH